MVLKTFNDPKEAYALLNKWSVVKTSYEIQFSGKEVTNVDVLFVGEIPTFATVHYKTQTAFGFESIDLSKNTLLDKPEEPVIKFLRRN